MGVGYTPPPPPREWKPRRRSVYITLNVFLLIVGVDFDKKNYSDWLQVNVNRQWLLHNHHGEFISTRKHSSRMHTARLSTISCGIPGLHTPPHPRTYPHPWTYPPSLEIPTLRRDIRAGIPTHPEGAWDQRYPPPQNGHGTRDTHYPRQED